MRLRDIIMTEGAAAESLEYYLDRIGDYLGRGENRVVHACGHDLVLKFESLADPAGGRPPRYQNRREWQIWQAVRDTEQAQWFAPCRQYFQQDGEDILVQERTQAMDYPDLPERVPEFVAYMDSWNLEQWGLLDGRPVLRDYGCADPADLVKTDLVAVVVGPVGNMINYRTPEKRPPKLPAGRLDAIRDITG